MIVDWYSSDDDAMPQTYITQLSTLTSTNQNQPIKQSLKINQSKSITQSINQSINQTINCQNLPVPAPAYVKLDWSAPGDTKVNKIWQGKENWS